MRPSFRLGVHEPLCGTSTCSMTTNYSDLAYCPEVRCASALVSMLVPDGRMFLPQGLCTAVLWLRTVPLCLPPHSLRPLGFLPKRHLDGTPIDHVHAPPLFCLKLPPRLPDSTAIHFFPVFCLRPCRALTSKLSENSSAYPILTRLWLSHARHARTHAPPVRSHVLRRVRRQQYLLLAALTVV